MQTAYMYLFLTASRSSIHTSLLFSFLTPLSSQKMSMLEDPTKLNEEDEEESEDQVNMKRYTETR